MVWEPPSPKKKSKPKKVRGKKSNTVAERQKDSLKDKNVRRNYDKPW